MWSEQSELRLIRLERSDTNRYAELRRRMLRDSPWAFGTGPGDHEQLGDEHCAMLAFEAGDTLVAMASITRQKELKFAHRARISDVFVDPAHRSRGLARALSVAAIELARSWQGVDFVDLSVSEKSMEALSLYESLGFRQWGLEPEATQHDGRRFDEIYMTLRLSSRSNRPIR